MFSRFFIDRPIFATVLSLVITIAGGVAVWALPLAQYPQITPPSIMVRCNYPGANAQVVAETVAAPIEQQVNGVEGMLYMVSQSTNDGGYQLTVTFKPGVNLNMAQVLVQNRVNLALPVLPEVVKQSGLLTRKRNPDILLIVSLVSPDNKYDQLYLNGYGSTHVTDELARVDGVSDVFMFGALNYSMRVWVDPDKLASRGLTAGDVVSALRQQNTAVAVGRIGQAPAPKGQPYQITLTTLGRLSEPSQFDEIVLRAMPDGSKVRIKDVGRCELGAQNMDITAKIDGKPCCNLAIFQLPDANALDTAERVRAKMEELKAHFPAGVDYIIAYDTTPFIRESIDEVFHTLRDATVLVAIVVLVFLQNWRSALIPLVAVPVAVVGTFAVMALMGFSLNNLTLFGLVLAIGIVVDDAIVVVEAVEHHIENGMSPRDATIRAMQQVSGPVVAVGLVLSAVFVPCAFISGITGQFFRQFALTIAVSTVISAFNSLTLSPALSALLLKHRQKGVYEALPASAFLLIGGWVGWAWLAPPLVRWVGEERFHYAYWALHLAAAAAGATAGRLLARPGNAVLGRLFHGFNVGFDWFTEYYRVSVGRFLRVSVMVLIVYGGLLYLTYVSFARTPTGFIPQQDKGYLLVNVQLPDAASLERTEAVMRRLEQIALETEGVNHTVALAGQSILLGANASNFGAMYVMLDEFGDRTRSGLSGDAIARRLQQRYAAEVTEAQVNVFGAPPVEGLGTAGGFKIILEDRGDNGLPELQGAADRVVREGNEQPGLRDLYTSFRANTPWLFIDIDRTQAQMNGVALGEIFSTLQIYLGSYYVNDFNRFGRTWQVNLQAGENFREQVEGLKQLKVRNADGKMLPLATVATVRPTPGPVMVMRYNMYPAAAINGSAGPNTSSGQALQLMQEAVKSRLDPTMQYEWTELALLQLQTGNTALYVFVLAVVLVFLVLAAQYESWSLPLAVILVVPMCLLCSIGGVVMARMDVNIFTQIGFVVLVGLACKNAILIVEFAKSRREAGVRTHEATLEACKLRLRPIIMTSFAFILGVVPLVLARGAGAEMRQTLGTAVFWGMLGVTLFGIFLTPVFYFVIQVVTERAFGAPEGARPEGAGEHGPALSPLARRLKQMREEAGLSHAELAGAAGLSTAFVTELEQGHKDDPRISTVMALAKGLRVGLERLLGEPPAAGGQ